MTSGDRIALALAAAVIVGSALVALAESSFARVSRIRALAWEEEGRRGATRLARLLEHPERVAAVTALFRMSGRIVAAPAVGIVGWRQGGGWGASVAVAAYLVTVLVVGELLPRRVSNRFGDAVALRAAGLAVVLVKVAPLVGLARAVVSPVRARDANGGTDDDEGGEPDEEIDEEERQLIHSIFEFGETVVREVMVPRTDMVALERDLTIDGALDVAIPAGFSRLPVLGDSPDHIEGLVFVKDLIRASRRGQGERPISGVTRKAVFVPEQKRVAELLREMQTRKFHMAVAVDEYGGTAGLVTLEDVLEEIVGEITDEYDVEEPRVEETEDGRLRVAGRTPIDELNELLGVELPATEWDTVGGLIFDVVGHVPDPGEVVAVQGIEFEAERVQGRRIVSVRVRRQTPGAGRPTPASADAPADAGGR